MTSVKNFKNLQRLPLQVPLAVLLLTGGALCAAPPAGQHLARSSADAPGPARGALPVVAEHKYRMLAKVRPLLFWIGRDDVGGARISWHEDQTGARQLDLLIGSDPRRAPRQINRWGYISEQVRGSEAQVLGVMKETKEQSIEEAEAGLKSNGSGDHVYRAIQGASTATESKASVTTVRVTRDLTFRDVDELLTMIGAGSSNGPARSASLPPGAKPGFLFAVRDLVDQSAAFYAAPSQRGRTLQLPPVQYVYNGTLYTLSVKSTDFLPAATIDGRSYSNLVRTDAEITNRKTNARTRFQLTYGTTGALAGIPVHIVYRPRWWFEAQLFLDDRTDF